jgi:hypothetical protein
MNSYDPSGKGKLTHEEFAVAVKEVCATTNASVEETLEAAFKACNKCTRLIFLFSQLLASTDTIEIHDFVLWLKGHPDTMSHYVDLLSPH